MHPTVTLKPSGACRFSPKVGQAEHRPYAGLSVDQDLDDPSSVDFSADCKLLCELSMFLLAGDIR